MKKLRLISVLFLIFVLLMSSACSASDVYRTSDAMSNEASYDSGEQSPSQSEAGTGQAPDFQINTENTGKKMIYTASIALKADDAVSAIDSIIHHSSELGGYLTDSSFMSTNDEHRGYVTVRIPPENLNELTRRIGDLGEIMDSNISSEDVTERYVDISARLANAQAQETQLLAIMEQAETIEEILLVRTELHYVQQEIEQYKGTLRYLDNQVDYSTVTVHITEKSIPTLPDVDPEEGLFARWTFSYIWANVVKGFHNGIAIISYILGGLLIALSYALVPLLIIGVIVTAIILIIKASTKKKKKLIKTNFSTSENEKKKTNSNGDK